MSANSGRQLELVLHQTAHLLYGMAFGMVAMTVYANIVIPGSYAKFMPWPMVVVFVVWIAAVGLEWVAHHKVDPHG